MNKYKCNLNTYFPPLIKSKNDFLKKKKNIPYILIKIYLVFVLSFVFYKQFPKFIMRES